MSRLHNFKQLLCILYLSLMVSFGLNAEITTEQSILNLKVKNDGIYRITHDDIINLGVDLTGINLSNISVNENGKSVPIKLNSIDGIVFDNSSYIEFVGLTKNSLYQQGNIYNLILNNNANNARVNVATQQPVDSQETVTHYLHEDIYEQNNGYSFGSPINDPWFSKRILAIGSEAFELLLFEIQDYIPLEAVNIEMKIWGGTDFLQSPDHHVIYQLNGTELDDFRFDGVTSAINNYQFNDGLLTNGTNEIKIIVPNDTNTAADVIHYESMKITYPRAFVIKDKKLQFKTQNLNGDSDLIYSNGFESHSPTILNNYSITSANNENHIIYRKNLAGSTDLIQYESSDGCVSEPTIECTLNFTLDNRSGDIYITSESEILKPELGLPVILTDINQGDGNYLIITHSDFIGPELDNFVNLKSQDYLVKVVDVEQIYAQYNHSNVSADSIADYIKFAALNFEVENVLLIGGDTYDYHNYLGLNSISFIPTLYGQTDNLITFAPIDAKFVDTDNDNIPDINIGRFPVRTATELENLVMKIEAYGLKSYTKTALFAADKFDTNNGYSFKDDAEEFISLLPQQWQENISIDNKAYLDNDGVTLAKAKIINNFNQGVALTSFIGHSGPRDWSFSRMFSANDADLLTNQSSPTLVTQWGCWNTYFVSPSEDTLAHSFMLNQNGGAASVLGASTLTKARHERELAKIVLLNLTQHEMTLGDAVTQAKRQYALLNSNALDVILGWNILGDPGLKL